MYYCVRISNDKGWGGIYVDGGNGGDRGLQHLLWSATDSPTHTVSNTFTSICSSWMIIWSITPCPLRYTLSLLKRNKEYHHNSNSGGKWFKILTLYSIFNIWIIFVNNSQNANSQPNRKIIMKHMDIWCFLYITTCCPQLRSRGLQFKVPWVPLQCMESHNYIYKI